MTFFIARQMKANAGAASSNLLPSEGNQGENVVRESEQQSAHRSDVNMLTFASGREQPALPCTVALQQNTFASVALDPSRTVVVFFCTPW
jgi:hypothetical protein